MKILLQPKCNLPTFKALRFIENLIRSKVKYISIMSCQLSNTPSIPQQFSITLKSGNCYFVVLTL